jgi:hypothetical protein
MVGTVIAVIIALMVGLVCGGLMASGGGTYKDEYIAIAIENSRLKKENEKYKSRLQISPYGDDKIDELESAMEFIIFENLQLRKDKDKSFMALPCKIGDSVKALVLRPYNNHSGTIFGKVIGIIITQDIVIKVLYDSCRTIDFYDTDFGKTIFLVNKENEKTEGADKC